MRIQRYGGGGCPFLSIWRIIKQGVRLRVPNNNKKPILPWSRQEDNVFIVRDSLLLGGIVRLSAKVRSWGQL